MSKKQISLLLLAVALGGLYIAYFSGWFAPKQIYIEHSIRMPPPAPNRNPRAPAGTNPPVNVVSFALNRKYELTDLKVVPLGEWQTNRNVHPVWHLVSDSNSVPTQAIIYGQNIRGMRPDVKGARPEPLQPNLNYHLIVQAGKYKGEHDFETTPR